MHILLQLGWLSGWVLGIIGFFSARSAHTELRRLRSTLGRNTTAELPPEAAPAPAPDPVVLIASPPVPRRDLEAMLTTRWSVWLGSAALLFAGVFLVRYAVEQALLGPAARCCLAVLLGGVLLSAAEWLQRHQGPPLFGPLRIDQAPSGLAAGGTAVLFGAAYGAGPFFGLLSPLTGFAAMAAASLIALASALRYGPLTAASGIAGAFATPALVATQTPSLPGLFGYLLIVYAAALLVGTAHRLGVAGLDGRDRERRLDLLAGFPTAPDEWAAAAFVPAAVGLCLLLLSRSAPHDAAIRRLAWGSLALLGAAGLALTVFSPGMAPRVALFVLSPIAVCAGVRETRFDRLPWVAGLFGLLTLLLWTLPSWTTGLRMDLLLPGVAAPTIEAQVVVPPLILAAVILAGFHAAAGLWLERRAPDPLPWAALVAAVPVLTLAVAYWRITGWQIDLVWAAAAVALAAGLTITALLAAHAKDRQRIGVHAAGVVAALALACGMLLRDEWLTLSVALFLPPLSWIEAQADLPALRQVALAVAGVVIVRLVLNGYVLAYPLGTLPLVNGLLPGYAVPAAAFAFAALQFRRRGDDRLVATLMAGAVMFLALFIGLEIRHWRADADLTGPVSFNELTLHLLTIAIQATAYLYVASHGIAQGLVRVVLTWAWRVLGAVALSQAVAVLGLNPMVTGAHAGLVALFAGYAAPGALAVLAGRRVANEKLRVALDAYAVVAGFACITLQIRQYVHPDEMSLHDVPVNAAELWGWSGGWLAYGVGLMIAAIRSGRRLLRLTALGVIGLVSAKVFAIDMAGLTGLWRVLSFLGLGLTLIGLGVAYRRFVLPNAVHGEQRRDIR